jgi:hypothetical protein
VTEDAPTTAEPPRATREPMPLRCPRCGAHVAPEQDWCLECGAPARTRLAPTPNWRLPIAVTAAVVVLALVALSIAFVALTRDDGTVPATTATTPPPAQPAETTPSQTVATPPAATTAMPPSTTPATTTPAPSGATTAPATTPAPLPGATTPTTPGR